MSRWIALLLLVPSLALAGPKEVEPTPFSQGGDPAAFDIPGGGSPAGAWAVGVSGGYPWSSVRAQVGLPGGLTPVLGLETALFRRWEPSVGVSGRILDRPRGRISGELLIGWTVEAGEVAQNGPRALARVRVLGILGRVAPWFSVATGHTVYVDETVRISAEGETSELSPRHEWTPVIEAGVVVGITKNLGIELGFDWHFVGAPERFALPGLRLGVHFGAGPRPAWEAP